MGPYRICPTCTQVISDYYTDLQAVITPQDRKQHANQGREEHNQHFKGFMRKEIHSAPLLDLKDTQCVLVSNAECSLSLRSNTHAT